MHSDNSSSTQNLSRDFFSLLSEAEVYLLDDNVDIEAAGLKLRKADELLASTAVINDKENKPDLKQNIDTLFDLNVITEKQKDLMHQIRMRTNAVVHGADDTNQIPTVAELRKLRERLLVEGRKIICQINEKTA